MLFHGLYTNHAQNKNAIYIYNQNAGPQLYKKEITPLSLFVITGISNKFTYDSIWNPSKLYIFRLTYCLNLFNVYRILIILSLCHSSVGLKIIHHCQSLDIMSLLSAWYKVVTLRIHVGYLSTRGLHACLVSALKTDPLSESFLKTPIELSFHAEYFYIFLSTSSQVWGDESDKNPRIYLCSSQINELYCCYKYISAIAL